MLTATKLTLWRGYTCLFDELSFALGPGEGLVLRGRNGSGKTTLLRVICGLTRAESGQVCWHGEPIEQVRGTFGRELAWCGHHTGLKADLSIRHNLEFAARLAGLAIDAWVEPLAELGLGDIADLPVRYLSAGQQRRTALARTLMSPGKLWLLDEPFTNLDVAGRAYVEGRLAAQLDAGGMVILAMHHDLGEPQRYRTLALGGAQ